MPPMLRTRLFRLVHDWRLSTSTPVLRSFHHEEFTNPEAQRKSDKEQQKQERLMQQENADAQSSPSVPGAMGRKYKVFRDEDAPEIFDVEEERRLYQTQDEPEQPFLDHEYYGLNLKRGIYGVYDIEDLVDVLRKETAEDVFVCSVPKELKYVDYMVVCSGRSYRHMLALAEFVRRIYKIKRTHGDKLPKIEGEKSRDWMALDLGNIALHIFSPRAREEYDLESLWAIGPEYDKECNKPEDPLVEMFEASSSSAMWSGIKPSSVK